MARGRHFYPPDHFREFWPRFPILALRSSVSIDCFCWGFAFVWFLFLSFFIYFFLSLFLSFFLSLFLSFSAEFTSAEGWARATKNIKKMREKNQTQQQQKSSSEISEASLCVSLIWHGNADISFRSFHSFPPRFSIIIFSFSHLGRAFKYSASSYGHFLISSIVQYSHNPSWDSSLPLPPSLSYSMPPPDSSRFSILAPVINWSIWAWNTAR